MNELEEKIYNGEKLTEEELSDAVFQECKVVDEIEGKRGRWEQETQSIISIKK